METKSSFSKRRSILVLLLIIAVGGMIYVWFGPGIGKAPESVVTSTESSEARALIVKNEEAVPILEALAVLKELKLNTEFFNDERFKALRATKVVIPEASPQVRNLPQILLFRPATGQNR